MEHFCKGLFDDLLLVIHVQGIFFKKMAVTIIHLLTMSFAIYTRYPTIQWNPKIIQIF